MGGIMDFLPQYQEFQQERDRTQEFVKNLMVYADQVEKKLQQENNLLRRQLQETKFDLEDATNSRRDLQQRLITAEALASSDSNGHSSFKNRNPHVVLLLDGNGLFFQEEYVRQGYDGGAKAALALQKVINSQCEGSENSGNTHTIVKIYADSLGLDQLMKRAGIVDECTRSFMLGFTQADTYFDYIDVGDQVAQTRSKIQDAAKWHLQDPSCKQVLLGISHDAGHVPFISGLIVNEEINRRVTILEGQPTVNELRSTNINIIAFDSIFRADKPAEIHSYTQSIASASSIAPSTPSSAVATPAMAPARIATPSVPPRTATPSAAPATMTWASITRKATPPPVITLPIPLKTNTSGRSVSASKPLSQPDWNPGLRGLDLPIPINQTVLDTVKKRKDSAKLCNNHYLRGPCTKGEDCCFEHHYKPNKEELNAIAFLARLNPCTSGQDCEVDNCIYGHHCPSVVNNVCVHPFCKFRSEEHPPGTKFKFPRTGSE